MKIFLSYSRNDADLAQRLNAAFMDDPHYDIFTDTRSIRLGDTWSNTIEGGISACDLFVVIITLNSLRSPEVEKEVIQAKKERKKIIPCIYSRIKKNQIKWDLANFQGVEFEDGYDLGRKIYEKILEVTIEPTQEEEEEEESKYIIKKKGSSPSAKYNKTSQGAQPLNFEALQKTLKENPWIDTIAKGAARRKTLHSGKVSNRLSPKMEDGFWVCRICGVKSLSDGEYEDHYRAVHHFGP